MSRLRRQTSEYSSEQKPSQDTCTDGRHNADTSVEDLLSDHSPYDTADKLTCTRDMPMEYCSASVVTASNTEPVDITDTNMVPSLLSLMNLHVVAVCMLNSFTEQHGYEMLGIFTMRCYASAVLAVVVCLSICPSVTHWYCVKMAKHWITQGAPHDSPRTLIF